MDSTSDSSKPIIFRSLNLFETKHFVAILISFVLVFAIIISYYFEHRLDFSIGDIAPYDITSPSTQPYYNRIKTEELRQQAEEKVSIIYRKNPLILDSILQELSFLKSEVQSQRINRIKTDNEKILEIEKLLSQHDSSRAAASLLIQTDEKNLEDVFVHSASLMSELLERGIQEEELQDVHQLIDRKLVSYNLQEQTRLAVSVIAAQTIRPNMAIDEDATNRQKEEARQKIVPVRETIIQNEIIVAKGNKITPEDFDKLQAVGRISETKFWRDALKALLFALLLLLVLLLFILQHPRNDLFSDWKSFLLLFGLVVAFIFIVRIIAPINQFLIPVFIFAILIRIFFEPVISYYFSLTVVGLSLMIFGTDHQMIISYLLATFIAMVLYSRFKNFTDFILRGIYSSFALAILSFLFIFYFPDTVFYQHPLLITGLAFSNGLIASLLSLGIVILLGNYADFITPLRLFELSDPNSMLLRKLFEIAPGTYQHSIMIANLSSHAAEAIGADPLIARVGSYYHDIGKTISPLSFTENSSGKNLLDEMEPIDAVKIIKSHVVNGLKLAKRYKLPSFIFDFITSHHGDSRISFMFESAKKVDKKLKDDSEFRYPGPKPVSKEVSIVMLADSVEAAVRSIEDKTQEKLEKMVDDIFNHKISNNQLDHSDLTFKDLERIKQSFLITLDSLYHVRLSYPTEKNKQKGNQE